ncbi:MAG: cytochrome c biogenesis CcdA family protein [Candidatus Thorarchaeota archaeon]|jgi:cytochrome c biogenesis protein CcdA
MQGIINLLIDIGATFGVGFYVAISPCLFPLLPLFLIRNLNSTNSRKHSLLITAVLVIGILSSLAVYTVIIYIIGGAIFFLDNQLLLQAILGTIIVFFGIVTISQRLKDILGFSSLNIKEHPEKPTGLWSVFTVGLGYSIIAAPCTGGAILGAFGIFAYQTIPLAPLLLFLAMSLGVAIPYLALALVTGETRTRLTLTLANSARKIEIAVGILLIIVGFLLITPYYGLPILL